MTDTDVDDEVTEAHDQTMTVHILTHVPEHQPRESDPHYNLFNQAKARMKRQGLWKCAINDDYCGGNIELHHSHIEFSQVGSSDLKRVNEAFGLHLTDDDAFQSWIESPGNLEPLCEVHHRTHYGVHVIPGPLWEPLRYRKANAKPSAEFITAAELKGGVDVATKTTKSTTTRARATKAGVETDTKTDVVSAVKVTAGHKTIDEHVEKTHVEEHRVAPKAHQPEKKAGFLGRMFGRD